MANDEHIDLHTLLPADLADRCADAQEDRSHEPYCLELFRRAIVAECPVSWHILHTVYYSLVRYWVGDGIERDSITQDDLTQDAFAAFWRSYTADKLACASGLGSVLSYLKSCAITARLQESRRASSRGTEIPSDDVPHLVVDSNPSPEMVVVEASTVTGLWKIVVSHCRSEIEQLVARLTLLADMKPSEIAAQYPDCFEDVTDIYRIKRNLLDRLRRDLKLQVIYETSVDSHLFR